MRIEKLYASKIGVFEELEVEFEPTADNSLAEVHILTGANGSGKSTILYLLALFFGYQDGAYKRFRDKDSFCEAIIGGEIAQNRLIQPTNEANMVVPSKSFLDETRPITHLANYTGHTNNTQKNILHYSSGNHQQSIAYSYFQKNQQYQANNKLQQSKFDFIVLSYSGNRNVASVALQGIIEPQHNPFENALSFQNSTNPNQIVQWIANTITKIALARSRNDIAKAEKLQNNLTQITAAVTQVSGYEIEFELEDDPLNVVLKIHGNVIEFDVLPDGLKSIISWIADILMRMDRIAWVDDRDIFDREFILLLDEVDIHLHPSWQRKILPMVQKLFKNAQIFVSTHSPFVVASVENAWIYKLESEGGVSKLTGVDKAKSGFSFGYILEEIFGIDEEFDIQTEEEFKEFYTVKDELLNGQAGNEERFLELAKKLADKSLEVKNIVARELRQLSRVLNKEYAV